MRCIGTLILIAILWSAAAPASGHEPLKPGTLAPRFHLITLDGKRPVDSKDLFPESAVTVLVLWDSYCPDCLATVKECQRFADRVEEHGVRVVGINYDRENLAAVRGFLKAGKIRFLNLHDRTGDVIKAYRAAAYDFSFFVIDRKGIVRHAAYDHPPEIGKVLETAVRRGMGEASPLPPEKNEGKECEPGS